MTKLSAGNFGFNESACSKSRTSTIPPNKCLTSAWRLAGACTLSVAQPRVSAGISSGKRFILNVPGRDQRGLAELLSFDRGDDFNRE